jgi:hypothetical protein
MTVGESITDISSARREAARLKQQLDALYTNYSTALHDVPINFQGELHKYMCVRLAGYLEQLIFVAVVGYLKSTAGPQAASFALSNWKHAPNLSPQAIQSLFDRFGGPWDDDLKQFLEDTDRKGALGTLIKIRNDTAHGDSYSGSLPSVASYKQLVDEIHGWVNRVVFA